MTQEELDEQRRKRERRMQKNRESASASRRRKKELMEKLNRDLAEEKERNKALTVQVRLSHA